MQSLRLIIRSLLALPELHFPSCKPDVSIQTDEQSIQSTADNVPLSQQHNSFAKLSLTSGGSGKVGRLLKQLNWKLEDIYLNLGDGDESTSEWHWLFIHF